MHGHHGNWKCHIKKDGDLISETHTVNESQVQEDNAVRSLMDNRIIRPALPQTDIGAVIYIMNK